MSEKHLLNLLYIAVAILFWLLPLALRYLRKRRLEAEKPGRAPARVPSGPEFLAGPGEDLVRLEDVEAELRVLSLEAGELALGAAGLSRSCTDTGLAAFGDVIDEAVVRPAEALRRTVDAFILSPEARDPLARAGQATADLVRLRATASFLQDVLAEHGREGFAEKNARGVALSRVFLRRIAGLAGRIAPTPSDPLFLPVEVPSRLHTTVLAGLSGTRVVAFRARPGRIAHPQAWMAIARDIATWAYHRSPALESELEQHYAEVLRTLGYRPEPPPEGLAREAFVSGACALMLGDLSMSATSGPDPGLARDLARRTLELAGMSQEDGGALPLPLEIMLHVLTRIELASLSGSRLVDDLEMRFDFSDASRVRAAAEALAGGEIPSLPAFHVIAGSMRESLEHPENAPRLAALVDRAIGVTKRRDAWKADAPATSPSPTGPAFLSPGAVREAIVIGALLER